MEPRDQKNPFRVAFFLVSPVSRGLDCRLSGRGSMLGLSLKALAVSGLSLVALSGACSPVVMPRLLIGVASLVAEHRL